MNKLKRDDNSKQVFVFDDAFGKSEEADEERIKNWNLYNEDIQRFFYYSKMKLLMTCEKKIFNSLPHNCLRNYEPIDIDAENTCLTISEKRNILKKYASITNLSSTSTDFIWECSTKFPLLCRLLGSNAFGGTDLFRNPDESIKRQIEHYKNEDKEKYCALVFLVIYGGSLLQENITSNRNLQNQIYKLCKLPEDTQPVTLIESLDNLNGSFVEKVAEKYTFIHNYVEKLTMLVFGKDCPTKMLEFCESDFIAKHVHILNENSAGPKDSIMLKDADISFLVKRFFKDIESRSYHHMLMSPLLKDKKAEEEFKRQIDSKTEDEVLNLFTEFPVQITSKSVTDVVSRFSKFMLLESKSLIFPLEIMLIYKHNYLFKEAFYKILKAENAVSVLEKQRLFSAACANPNITDIVDVQEKLGNEVIDEYWNDEINMGPIHIAAAFGNYKVVKSLIDNKQNVNIMMGDRYKLNPLLIATLHDRSEVVDLLLSAETNVDDLLDDHTPLFVASKLEYEKTLKVLLKNGANVNKTGSKKKSALFIASKKGNADIVQILLDNHAHVDLCNHKSMSPLFIASIKGHEDVKLLLKNKADPKLRNEFDKSPYGAACKIKHENILAIFHEEFGKNQCIKEYL